ncbi:MAG: hypothetical protein CML60_01525 [Rhodobacteraceae bacterium]|nr:hypothetical protein [Paracoccaceae bacterium]
MTDHAWLSVTNNSNVTEVRSLQEMLVAKGHSVGIDGRFGIGTQRCVVEFQNENNLTPDGNVGPATWAALEGGAKKKAEPKAEAEEKADAKPAAKKAPAKKPAAKKAPAKKGS